MLFDSEEIRCDTEPAAAVFRSPAGGYGHRSVYSALRFLTHGRHFRTNDLTVEVKPPDDAAEDIHTFSNFASPSLV